MTDINRPAMLKRLREIKELADATFWQVIDLRILLHKAEASLTAAKVNSCDVGSSVLGEDEHYSDAEDYQPGDSDDRHGDCS